MTLTAKPHCKKHDAFVQGCIGCRIKAKNGTIELDRVITAPHARWERDPRPGSTQGSDLESYSPEVDTAVSKSAQINEAALKQFLKSVYNDGAVGNKRSLAEDVQTIKDLLH